MKSNKIGIYSTIGPTSLNKTFFKEETYPSNLKIFIWDKIFTPLTIVFDYLTRYKFGKNILCIYQKINL